MPDAVEPCAAAASRICSDTCEWSECRACEPAETRACGNCGTQTCDGAGWGSCEDEGVCAPGSSVACALGGNRTCSASCMLQPCDVAAALSFADGDEVNLPFTSAVEITDFTLEVWVRTRILLPTESREFLFLPTGVGAALDHDSGYGFGVGSFGDGSRLYVSTDGYTVPFNRLPVVPDNAWHHVAVSRDGGSVTAFVDGTASSTLRFDGAASIRTESLFFGGVEELPPETGLRRFFQGELHSARIWSVARTAAEIRTSMTTAGRIADRDGLLVELLFNEGSGQTVTNTVNGDVGTRGKTNAAESIDPSWISR